MNRKRLLFFFFGKRVFLQFCQLALRNPSDYHLFTTEMKTTTGGTNVVVLIVLHSKAS